MEYTWQGPSQGASHKPPPEKHFSLRDLMFFTKSFKSAMRCHCQYLYRKNPKCFILLT